MMTIENIFSDLLPVSIILLAVAIVWHGRSPRRQDPRTYFKSQADAIGKLLDPKETVNIEGLTDIEFLALQELRLSLAVDEALTKAENELWQRVPGKKRPSEDDDRGISGREVKKFLIEKITQLANNWIKHYVGFHEAGGSEK
jgi:hypothetical protein